MRYILKRLEEIPERRGAWSVIQGGSGRRLECSACENRILTEYRTDVLSYCPFCGARMEGDNGIY